MKEIRFVFVIIAILLLVLVVFVETLDFQNSENIEGIIQEKIYQEKKCTQEPTFDPALNMVLLKDDCNGPYWKVTINNRQYHVTERLYNTLEIDKFYTFTYHPLKGMSLLNE